MAVVEDMVGRMQEAEVAVETRVTEEEDSVGVVIAVVMEALP